MAPQPPYLPETAEVIAARRRWRYTGTHRPGFAEPTATGEESVWDYPRPPAVEPCTKLISVRAGSRLIAATRRGVRVLETAGAPTYYFPPEDVDADLLTAGPETSLCEWKGLAQPLTVAGVENAGWRYIRAFRAYEALLGWPSFYPARLTCFVDDEPVTPQPGGYYGGWVTPELKGPIKGDPGSADW